MTNRPTGFVALLALVVALGLDRPLSAQSLTSGGLSGTVRDVVGRPVDGADVTVVGSSSALIRATVSGQDGGFSFALLPPGDYDLLVERLGYRPLRMLGVTVRSGLVITVPIALTQAPPPVTTVDTAHYVAAGLFATSGTSQWFAPFTLRTVPDRYGFLNDLGRLSTATNSALEVEGLPGGLSGYLIDGVPFRPARHPAAPSGTADGAVFPTTAFDRAEIVFGGADVEWSGVAGGTLGGDGRRGGDRFNARLFADWSGNAFSSSKYFDTGAVPNSSMRGGLLLSGPVIRDTAHFVLGVEARRLETPVPPAWGVVGAAAGLGNLIVVARDSFGVNLNGNLRPRVVTSDVINGFGRFDWQFSSSHALSVGGSFASNQTTDPVLGRGFLAVPGAVKLDASDFLAYATLTSILGRHVSQELRLGISGSRRDYSRTGPAATLFIDPAVGVGADAALPGTFRRTALTASDALHFGIRAHQLKAGLALTLPSYHQTYAYGRPGEFLFGGANELAARQGVFEQTVGQSPDAKFSAPVFGGFLQDTWAVVPGLDLLLGARYDMERVPHGEIPLNTAWRQAAGLSNTDVRSSVGTVSPRLGFTWDVGARRKWLISGEAGMYADGLDPALFAELVNESGSQRVRRGVGAFAAWPATPDSTRAPVLGPRLTLLGPDFQAPRSKRFGIGIAGALGGGMVLRLQGAYRHTDFLPRRHDLNLALGPAGRDQYGRPIFGTLIQQGSLVTGTPGSNRRFAGFDLVSALDPDGYADYNAITLSLERSVGRGLSFLASYTHSRTEDNWLTGRGGPGGPSAQLTPFPDSLAGADWAKGRSDFDVPDRVVLAVDFAVPRLRGLHLAAVYRYRAGYPFTPGFRAGVDANGDGSDRNDPAFVDDTVSGVAPVIGQWTCLRSQIGHFAERNSCREPGVHALDLRFELNLLRIRGSPFALVVDALNIVESDTGIRDRALYLVDRARSLSTTAGVTTVPLVANPEFGTVLVHETSGRLWRLGLRVNY